MQKGPFGLMVHWLKATAPKEGRHITDWNEKVDRFDLDTMIDTVADSGAGWLIFTLGQNEGVYNTHNDYLESILPGRCSRRDLGLEVARACTERGIRFVAYLPAEVRLQDEGIRGAFGWGETPAELEVFQDRYQKFIRAFAEHLGEHLHGWWFDGCYQCVRSGFTWDNTRFDWDAWGGAVRAGNPEAVYAMNPGANTYQPVSMDEDYLGGEANDLSVKPGGPTVPLIGEPCVQWHALTYLDCVWGHSHVGEMPPPRFWNDELFAWVKTCHLNGGAVTLNVGIYQDGSIDPKTVAQLQDLKGRMASVRSHFVDNPE